MENVIAVDESEDLFGDEFIEALGKINMPITKFNALIKLLRDQISGYGTINNCLRGI